MTRLLELLSVLRGQAGIAALLTLFFAGLFLYVMTRNYRRMIGEQFRPGLLEGEKQLARIEVTGIVTATRTVVTDRRVLQLSLAWLLSRRKTFAVAWSDTHSVTFRRSLGLPALILGVLLAGRLNPAAFLLILWGLDSRSYAISFGTPFAFMLRTRIRVASRGRGNLPKLANFYRHAQSIWARFRSGEATGNPAPEAELIEPRETDFALGKTVWMAVLAMMACAIGERALGQHVGFDSMPWAAVSLAAPVVAGRFSLRDGLWAALLGFVGILTVKFPMTGLFGFFASDGGRPYLAQYAGVLMTLLLMSAASSAAARLGRPSLSALAALLWIPYVAIHMPAAVLDLDLFARVAAAVGLASAVVVVAPITK